MNLLLSTLLISTFLSFFVNSVLASFKPLQVSVQINGFSVPAIIDTGAEVTVMSLACAKRCRLANAIDTRHSGTAVGVGVTDIVGRIDDLELRLGEAASISNKISVLRDSKCDFILGLDVLEKHHCDINFKNKRLKMTIKNKTVKIPLLPSHSTSYDPEDISMNLKQPAVRQEVRNRAHVEVTYQSNNPNNNLIIKKLQDNDDEENDEMDPDLSGDEPISMAGI